MRSRFLLPLVPLALAFVAAAFPACESEEQLDNLCLFLKDEDSCYRNFLTDIGEQCTMSTYAGTFDTRDALSKCTITNSGTPENIVTQVDFDPPIELTQLPYKAGLVKLTINGTQCGTIEFGENNKLAVTMDTYPVLTDPAVECVSSDTQFCGSSFSNTPIETETVGDEELGVTTTCANGETYTFNRLEVEQQCSDMAGHMPKLHLSILPNGVGKEGEVKLYIQYTPTIAHTYLTCKILEQLPACANGVKDGLETDTDCGGGVCTGCGHEQGCISGSDCLSKECAVTNGIKKCSGNGGAGGAGGAGGSP